MRGKVPADYRWLFPLAPVFAVGVSALFAGHARVNSAPNEPVHMAQKIQSAQALASVPLCCQTIPSRFSAPPKSEIKFVRVDRGGVDYDAGNALVSVVCSFTDLCPEKPVVGMCDMGFMTRLQTDAGTVAEGRTGIGVINPAIHQFKNAQFVLEAKVPLAAKSVNILRGALTVQRARERVAMLWREPFGAELGSMRKAGGFEMTLTKCAIANDVLSAEWNCKPPVEVAQDAKWWETRGLTVSLTAADKAVFAPEKSKNFAMTIQRTFRLNKKFPATLELSIISDLRTENVPFELTRIILEGGGAKKSEPVAGENF